MCVRIAGFVLAGNEENLVITHVIFQIFHQCNIYNTKRTRACVTVSQIHLLSAPCLKKLCQFIFCYVFVKYELILITIGRPVPEETINKTVQKVPTSPIMCGSNILRNLK